METPRNPEWMWRNPWACNRLLWSRNKLVLFIPQHNLSPSDFKADAVDAVHIISAHIYGWEHCCMDSPGSRASRAVYTPSPWKQRRQVAGGSWHLACLECSPPTPCSAHSPHPPKHSLLRTLNILLSLSSEFRLICLQPFIMCHSF